MMQCLWWETDSHLASQEIPHLHWILFWSRINQSTLLPVSNCIYIVITSSFPGATNETLLQKFNSVHKENNFYEIPQRREAAFIVRHYAGKVKYQVNLYLMYLIHFWHNVIVWTRKSIVKYIVMNQEFREVICIISLSYYIKSSCFGKGML